MASRGRTFAYLAGKSPSKERSKKLFTLITTFVTEKIVVLLTVSLVAVAAVPTALILTTDEQTAVVLQQQQGEQQIVLVKSVQKAGDDAIVKLENAENSCNTQITGLVTAAKLNPGKIQSQLAQAKTTIHGSVAPYIAQLKEREQEFAAKTELSDEDEQNELNEIQQIEIIALGGNGTTGTVTVTCQTVTIQIKLVIQVTVVQVEREHEGDDH